jgi:hypothetical protein
MGIRVGQRLRAVAGVSPPADHGRPVHLVEKSKVRHIPPQPMGKKASGQIGFPPGMGPGRPETRSGGVGHTPPTRQHPRHDGTMRGLETVEVGCVLDIEIGHGGFLSPSRSPEKKRLDQLTVRGREVEANHRRRIEPSRFGMLYQACWLLEKTNRVSDKNVPYGTMLKRHDANLVINGDINSELFLKLPNEALLLGSFDLVALTSRELPLAREGTTRFPSREKVPSA